MIGDEGLFASLDHYDNPTETIIYGDKGQGDVVGLGNCYLNNKFNCRCLSCSRVRIQFVVGLTTL
jgi:hypothetical protein